MDTNERGPKMNTHERGPKMDTHKRGPTNVADHRQTRSIVESGPPTKKGLSEIFIFFTYSRWAWSLMKNAQKRYSVKIYFVLCPTLTLERQSPPYPIV